MEIHCLSWSWRIWSVGYSWSADWCASCVIYTSTDKSTLYFPLVSHEVWFRNYSWPPNGSNHRKRRDVIVFSVIPCRVEETLKIFFFLRHWTMKKYQLVSTDFYRAEESKNMPWGRGYSSLWAKGNLEKYFRLVPQSKSVTLTGNGFWSKWFWVSVVSPTLELCVQSSDTPITKLCIFWIL